MNRILTLARAALLPVTLLGLAACGKAPESENQKPASAAVEDAGPGETPPPAGAAQTMDVCGLLSNEEIQQASGLAVHASKAVPAIGKLRGPSCEWELESVPQGLHRISIDILRPNGRERFNFVSPGFPAIPGVGEGAVKHGGNTDGTLWAVTGDTLVTLRYSLPVTTIDPDPLVLPLLKLVVSRQ